MIRKAIGRLVGLVDWLYGRPAAGIDCGLGAIAAGWGTLMLARPAIFDAGAYAGMTWLPDPVWSGLMIAVALLHLAGVLRPAWINLRTGTALVSAWIWLFIAMSLLRIALSPGVITYSILGVGALFGAIHIAGSRQRRG